MQLSNKVKLVSDVLSCFYLISHGFRIFYLTFAMVWTKADNLFCPVNFILLIYMKRLFLFAVSAFCLTGFSSCTEKKKSDDIIATKPVVAKAQNVPTKMSEYERTENVEWDGGTYKITVRRSVSDRQFSDENGRKYYDNRFTLTILRPDGSEFVRRELTKESYSGLVDNAYLDKSTALGLAFLEVKGGKLVFLASVGSPDELSDDLIPISISVSRDGSFSMKESDNNGDSSEEE